jgi:hypothetical protein
MHRVFYFVQGSNFSGFLALHVAIILVIKISFLYTYGNTWPIASFGKGYK